MFSVPLFKCLVSRIGALCPAWLFPWLLVAALPQAGVAQPLSAAQVQSFAREVDSIRVSLKIPALAAALMQGDSVVWAQGYGYSDVATREKTTPQTTFRIASVTKTFTSTLLMQLVETGKLDLNAPVSRFGLNLGNQAITVKHLLTHTSEGEPGTRFQYNGYLFGRLGPVIEQAAGKAFHELLLEKILQPLQMSHTAPDVPLYDYFTYAKTHPQTGTYFANAFAHLAKPYALNDSGAVVAGRYNHEFGAFGGMVSNVTDVLKYAAALDRNQFVTARTQKDIFTPNVTKDGRPTPYGLGWFTQTYKGVDWVWHFGQSSCESALLVKVPSLGLTFVALANTDKLSQPFPLGDGDLLQSPLGQLFYRMLVNAQTEALGYRLPAAQLEKQLRARSKSGELDFYNRELITQAIIANLNRNPASAQALYRLYGSLNFPKQKATANAALAEITQVSNLGNASQSFTLRKPTKVRVVGVGENCSVDFKDWCDYGWIEQSGKVVWDMKGKPAASAGGAAKNQQVDAVIELPPGTYQLRYQSDYAHAYNAWDSAPPTHFAYGIALYVLP